MTASTESLQGELSSRASGQPVPIEQYGFDRRRRKLARKVRLRDGGTARSYISGPEPEADATADDYDSAWLRSAEAPPHSTRRGTVRLVDLFSGCGALSLGITEACRALELGAEHLFSGDTNEHARGVYRRNFPGGKSVARGLETLVQTVDAPMNGAERRLRNELGEVDILAGGPPCQGHSDLNNHTRRRDPRNALFSTMIRFAQVLRPTHVIIENVPGVRHDKGKVTELGRRTLESMGYRVTEDVVLATEFGVPQRRRRYVMVATTIASARFPTPDRRPDARTIRWACGDLVDASKREFLDSKSSPSRTNRERIDYLFDHDLYDLPDAQRPPCHRDKKHSYRSVYGRLRWEDVAPTITSGFNSPGQGRFTHPQRRRTLTPHEAARLQFIPDFFDWGDSGREALTQMIGNAVPPKIAYWAALDLLR